MKRSPELEAMAAADESAVRDIGARRNQWLGGTALILVGALAAYFLVLAPASKPKRGMIDNSDEQFRTTTFRAPSFVRNLETQPAKPDQKILKLPPPPPPPQPVKPDTTEFKVPPPAATPTHIPASTDPSSSMPPAKDKFPKRFRSKMIVLDAGRKGSGKLNGESAGAEAGPTVAGTDRNSKFLATASSIAGRTAHARQLKRLDALIPEGTMIPGILETAINSDLPGEVRAIVSKDVYSFDGRRVLIPTGTRLIGEYQSAVTRGQKRIFVVWTRLIRNDGVSIRLNSIGADSLGRSGVPGHVDNKFRERFTSAILLSIVGAGSSYLTGYGSGQAFSDNQSDARRGEDLARQTIAQTFSDMANQALRKNLALKPTISVPQGKRLFVYVRQDLDFSAMYDDPVTEAMKEIKRERRRK